MILRDKTTFMIGTKGRKRKYNFAKLDRNKYNPL